LHRLAQGTWQADKMEAGYAVDEAYACITTGCDSEAGGKHINN